MSGGRYWCLALAILMLAAAVRFYRVGERSLSYREILEASVAREDLHILLPAVRSTSGATPLHSFLMHWVAQYGLEEGGLRAGAVFFGVAGVAALLVITAELLGRRTALLASLLLAVSPLHVAYSRQVRPQALLTCLALIMLLLLCRLWRGRGGVALAIGAGTAAAYAGYQALFLAWAAALAALLTGFPGRSRWQAAARVCTVAAAITVASIPWLLHGRHSGFGAQLFVSTVNWTLPRQVVNVFAYGERAGTGGALGFFLAACALAGAVAAMRRTPQVAGFLLVVLVGGGAAVAALAVAMHRVLAPGELLFLLPLYLAFAGHGLDTIAAAPRRRRVSGLIAVVLGTVAAVLFSPSLKRVYRGDGSDWRAAAAVILPNIGVRDAVAVPTAGRALLFYAPELERRLGPQPDLPVRAVAGRLLAAERGWVVAPVRARLQPQWKRLRRFLRTRVAVDLSPSPEPAVYFVTNLLGRRTTYREVSYFDLPVPVLAQRAIIRDWLLYVGPTESVLEQIDRLLAAKEVSPRNPTLLEAVASLQRAGFQYRARTLAQRMVRGEPQWEAARRALAALGPTSGPPPNHGQ